MMPSRSALLLIDFQRDFMADDGRKPIARGQVEPLVAAANRAIAAAREKGIPVVAIGNEFKPNDWLMNLFRRNAAVAGSSGAAWDERVAAPGAPYFAKTQGDAFSNPDLGRYLADLGVDEVVLAGIMAGACVTATARGARKAALRVRVLADAVADTSDRAKSRALDNLAAMRGISVDRSEALDRRPG